LFVVVLAKAADLIEWHLSACKWQELSCVIHTFSVLDMWEGTGCIHFYEDRCTFRFLGSRVELLGTDTLVHRKGNDGHGSILCLGDVAYFFKEDFPRGCDAIDIRLLVSIQSQEDFNSGERPGDSAVPDILRLMRIVVMTISVFFSSVQ
jgi:hypothetical protein